MLANRDTEVVVCCAPVIGEPIRLTLDDLHVESMRLINSPGMRLPAASAKDWPVQGSRDSAWMNCDVAAFQSSPPHDFIVAHACNSNYSGLLI